MKESDALCLRTRPAPAGIASRFQMTQNGALTEFAVEGSAGSACYRPRSWIASTTMPVPIAISRMSVATRT